MTEKLRISVVEDNANTRTLIKNHLVANKFGTVNCYKNGAPLLKQNEIIDTDVIIIGMELENSYAGSDLIRHLARLKKLHPWTKVIFVTNQSERVRSDLPLLGQKCDVIDKPINFKQLSRVIAASKKICDAGKNTFSKLDESTDQALVSLVKTLPQKVKNEETLDSVRLLQSKLLLKLNRPKLIFTMLDNIKDAPLRHLAQMHYFLYFGQLNELRSVLQSTKELGILETKRNNFFLFQNVIDREYKLALDTISQKKESELLPPEVSLKATLIALVNGVQPAIKYLQKKRNVSLENHYYRSAITINIMFLCCFQLVIKRDPEVSPKEALELIKQNTLERSLNHAGNDFKSFVPFITLACKVVNNEYQRNLPALYVLVDDLVSNTVNMEPTKRILLFIIFSHVEDVDKAFEQLSHIAKLLTDVEVSSELIVNYLTYDLFVNSKFEADMQATMLNKLGKSLFEQRFPAAALRLFYRSFKTAPESVINTLNLLSTLVSTQLSQYMDTNIGMLLQDLEGKSLDDKHTQTFEDLKKRLERHHS